MASLVQKKIFYGITVGNTNKDLELNKSIVIDSFHSSIENLNIPRSFFCTEDCNRFSRSNTNEFGFFKKKKFYRHSSSSVRYIFHLPSVERVNHRNSEISFHSTVQYPLWKGKMTNMQMRTRWSRDRIDWRVNYGRNGWFFNLESGFTGFLRFPSFFGPCKCFQRNRTCLQGFAILVPFVCLFVCLFFVTWFQRTLVIVVPFIVFICVSYIYWVALGWFFSEGRISKKGNAFVFFCFRWLRIDPGWLVCP